MSPVSRPPGGRPATLDDVAALAGVSQSTASRVMNGSDRAVGAELRSRVMRAADELDYAPDTQAQAVARGRTVTVALLVSDIAVDYFASMAAAVMRSAERVGLRVTIAVTERDVRREIDLVRELRGQKARAIVLAESGRRSADGIDDLVSELRRYERTGGKVVAVSRSTLPFDYVDLDNIGGAYRLATDLVDAGHRRFTVLAGDPDLVVVTDRVQGLRAGLGDRGIPLSDDDVIEAAFSWEGAFDAVQAMSPERLARTDVLFAVNDEMALGAMAALRERGLRIPEDVAVAGFDDLRRLRDTVPALTTVHVPVDAIGDAVLDLILERSSERVDLPARVVLRESTARRP